MKFKEFLEVLDPDTSVEICIRVENMPFSVKVSADSWLKEEYSSFWDLEIITVYALDYVLRIKLKGNAKL